MSWLYVPGVEGSTSDSDSPCPKRVQSLTWNAKPSPLRTWLQRWKRERWMRRLSGLTCEPSTLDRGVERWIASLPGTPASRSASRGKSRRSSTRGTSGRSSAKRSRTASLEWSFSRTSPTTCDTALMTSPSTFEAWASRLRQHCGARAKSTRHTCGNAFSSLLPTLSASGYGSSNNGQRPDGTTFKLAGKLSLRSMARTGQWPDGPKPTGQLNPTWAEWLMGWPLGFTAYACSETE